MKPKSIYTSFLLSSFAIGLAQPAFAANYPWSDSNQENNGSYHFYYQQEQLSSVLKKIASTYNIKISIDPALSPSTLKGIVSGSFDLKSPTDLLNKLASDYGFLWFYYSNTLYITSNKKSSTDVSIAPESMSSIKNILSKEGLLSENFAWTELPAENRVVISGPSVYLDIVTKRLKKLNVSPINQQFAIFRLKYASAVDTTINLNNSQIVVPGVATILKNILDGKSGGGSLAAGNDKLLARVAEPLKNQANAATALASGADASGIASSYQDTKSNVSSPLVQADARLNAIIIRDKASNLKVYKSLIDLLDVHTPLIQVDAMIIDFDQYKLNQSGISWWGSRSGVGGGFNSDQLKSSGGSGLSIGSLSPSNLIVSNIGGFLAKLEFLENNGLAKTESRSGVVTQDNLAAAINLTESFYSSSPSTQGGNPGQVNTNMTMLITPHVIFDNNQNKIKLSVSLQDGNIEEKVVNNMPTTMQGTVNSQAVINAGQSLLIAGYSRIVSEKVTNQVPVLSSVPIVGWLFKNSSTKERKFQRTYLISPKILWEGNHDDVAVNDTEELATPSQDSSDIVTQQPAQATAVATPKPTAQPQTADISIPDQMMDQKTPTAAAKKEDADPQSKANAQKFIDMISSSSAK